MKYLCVFLLTYFFIFTLAHAQKVRSKIIYGEDNRQEPYDVKSLLIQQASKTVAALIPSRALNKINHRTFQINSPSLFEKGYCYSERFSQQPAPARCSGFLITKDILVTAGHCLKSSSCSEHKWVFDFEGYYPGQNHFYVDESSVYKCQKVIKRKLKDNGVDYAVIKLDRPVPNRIPLRLRFGGRFSKYEKFAAIGHPIGLPKKVTSEGRLRKRNRRYFTTNLDTYGGNSGSIVVGLKSKKIEGILVRGGEDFQHNGSCFESNVVGENRGTGEEVVNIKQIFY
ncbi:serine protease [Bacteriovoracaceae bacterium]|nr:serine protease [Bacteriovoracaceae bacterium]